MIYYGETLHGQKVHMGTEVQYQHETGSLRVDTWCGNSMTKYSGTDESPLPYERHKDFCMTCFRGIAWMVLMGYLGGGGTLGTVDLVKKPVKV